MSGWGVAGEAFFLRRRVGLGGSGVSLGCNSGFWGEESPVASGASSGESSKSRWSEEMVAASPDLYNS